MLLVKSQDPQYTCQDSISVQALLPCFTIILRGNREKLPQNYITSPYASVE